MKIRDITLADIRAGKNWRLGPLDEGWEDAPMEEWGPLIETDNFAPEDDIVYSGVLVSPQSGRVRAIVLIKTVGDLDYGGDYCEFVDGGWRQMGLVPNPNAESCDEFIANPLDCDESFCNDGERYRRGFLRHIGKLES